MCVCVIAGDHEMTELKRRLMETEAQMSRILQAMEVVQQKVGAATADTAQLMVISCSLCAGSVVEPTHQCLCLLYQVSQATHRVYIAL